eukprot:scaffold12243_cov116-Isochrysis_galbana.AAC.4
MRWLVDSYLQPLWGRQRPTAQSYSHTHESASISSSRSWRGAIVPLHALTVANTDAVSVTFSPRVDRDRASPLAS